MVKTPKQPMGSTWPINPLSNLDLITMSETESPNLIDDTLVLVNHSNFDKLSEAAPSRPEEPPTLPLRRGGQPKLRT